MLRLRWALCEVVVCGGTALCCPVTTNVQDVRVWPPFSRTRVLVVELGQREGLDTGPSYI